MRRSENEKTAIRMTDPRGLELMDRLMWVKRRYCCARVPVGLLNSAPGLGV